MEACEGSKDRSSGVAGKLELYATTLALCELVAFAGWVIASSFPLAAAAAAAAAASACCSSSSSSSVVSCRMIAKLSSLLSFLALSACRSCSFNFGFDATPTLNKRLHSLRFDLIKPHTCCTEGSRLRMETKIGATWNKGRGGR